MVLGGGCAVSYERGTPVGTTWHSTSTCVSKSEDPAHLALKLFFSALNWLVALKKIKAKFQK